MMTYISATPARSLKPMGPSRVVVPVRAPALERVLGNQQCAQAQAKLRVSQRNDKYEQEADRVAEHMTQSISPAHSPAPAVQRKCLACEREERHTPIQLKALPGASFAGAAAPAPELGAGQPLPKPVRRHFEQKFGYRFEQVRVHRDARAGASAQQMRARAYTSGSHIVFGSGEYAPQTPGGEKLLAHELAHVVQQGTASGVPDIQRAETDEEVGCSALVDCSGDVNTEVNRVLRAAVAAAGTPVNADSVIDDAAFNLGGRWAVSPMERWAETALPSNKINQPTQSATRYRGVNTAFWPIASRILGPHIKIGSLCVGTDKLGHFFQQGFQYFQIARRQSGGTTALAEEFGRETEIGMSGISATGVYSNADLEANRKGMNFYDDLKASPAMSFSIAGYINANWNEQNNPNFYGADTGAIVWSNLLGDFPWTGFFDNNFTGLGGTPINVDFSATSAGAVTGSYSYNDAGAIVTGGITNGAVTQRTTTVTGTSTTATPVSGITLTFDWAEGGSTGKGTWASRNERELNGTWGAGSSRTNGGPWNLRRI